MFIFSEKYYVNWGQWWYENRLCDRNFSNKTIHIIYISSDLGINISISFSTRIKIQLVLLDWFEKSVGKSEISCFIPRKNLFHAHFQSNINPKWILSWPFIEFKCSYLARGIWHPNYAQSFRLKSLPILCFVLGLGFGGLGLVLVSELEQILCSMQVFTKYGFSKIGFSTNKTRDFINDIKDKSWCNSFDLVDWSMHKVNVKNVIQL